MGLKITQARRIINLAIVIDTTGRTDNARLTEIQASLPEVATNTQQYTDDLHILVPLTDSGT